MNRTIDGILALGFLLTIVVLVGSALVLGLAALIGFNSPIDSGSYTGQVIDYTNQRGLIFETNDLTTKTHERSSQREDWCVSDNKPQLVEKVKKIEMGQKVSIEYNRPLWVWIDHCENGLKVIQSIEVVQNE